ncbi:MAG TPA: methyltransferase domain-containing protein [Pirellulales bacterium]|nr:methyltransferase domain-containing protein [Pirellulales bacterium]
MPERNVTKTATTEDSVYRRYAAAAQRREEALCCPVEYAADFLSVIPEEILQRDYGCGDPTPYTREGETVLDLGSGGGKLCYILAQIVGKRGRVVGVDCNREMLELARKHQQSVADRLGFSNVDFRYGLIQDLKLDLDLLARELTQHPVHDPASWLALRNLEERLRREQPMIADDSVDCVVSNCVLNLVRQQDRTQLLAEIYRVLSPGGRAAISDIVSDEDVPERLQRDPALWSGCISGAFREDRFLAAFEAAGFHGIEVVKRQREPWRTVEGIEFRSLTVVAHKGKQGPCLERNQAVIYRGPFKRVEDDDGHVYLRGARTAVCDKTYRLLLERPYAGLFDGIEPRIEVPLAEAADFDCRRSKLRNPRETKGAEYRATTEQAGPCCDADGPCC